MAVNDGDVLRIAAGFTYLAGGDEQVNTYFFELLSGGPMLDANALIDAGEMMERLYTHVLATQPITLKYNTLAVKNVTQDLLLGTIPWPTLIQGTGTGVAVSSQVAQLIFGRTSVPRVQMRKYVVGLQEEDVSNSLLTGAQITALTNMALELVAFQFPTNGNWVPIAYNAVLDRRTRPVSAGVSLSTRTQRRRTLGRGA